MLFPRDVWPRVADGTVTVAFRRFRRPTVKAGGTLQSPAGLLGIDALDAIEPDDVTDEDARAAGYGHRGGVFEQLPAVGQLYRVRFHRIGDDPRIELRRRADLSGEDLRALTAAVGRLPWAIPVLQLIADNPGVVSTDLSARVGTGRAPFKARVRRLKALGLTESLDVGYRLSPRGDSLLGRLAEPDVPGGPATRYRRPDG
jgi:hypothetical protein